MKILVLHQYFLGRNDPGGSRYNQFVKYWEDAGHEITVVAGTVHYSTGKKEEQYKGKFIVKEKYSENVTVYRTHVSEAYNKSFLGRLWGYFSFTYSSLIAILFKIKKHDVIVVTSPPLFVGITGVLAKFLKSMPLIFEVRDLWPESAIDTGVLNNKVMIEAAYLVEKLSYKFANKINVLTPAFKTALIENKNVAEDKVTMIPNGADLDIFRPTEKQNWFREKYSLQDKFIITYMGAHGVANNLDSILNVAKKCSSLKDIVFLLVGDGMEKDRLKKRAIKEKIENVIFIDSQPKSIIPDICNASDICTAVLQKNDTFKTVYPNKVFDYMSCAKPILLGIDGVARELVEKSESGYYVDPNNSEEFKRLILKLYNDTEHLKELGKNGYKYVTQHFNRESLAKDYINEIERVVNKNV
ncbi:glycosyltransferase WbuB [Oceanobacillus zhaokaii]|uniref:Glycosyltransferase WbuB n=1 Tax=Oceanobacillus zhaokaii TaxID=2052660 RepID=A0A345PKD5_9BACI|nr:glycosyltransferase family 4 protein [Oceanobacillus zhaokaii]AXI10465.1 glycosyltransferase WbuB [Oceanobacillus zhaokaii]